MFSEIKNQIIDTSEKILRKSGWADKTICTLLRILHFGISFITGFILLFGPKFWFFVVVFFNLIVFFCYFIFGGCILSKIEHRFTDDDFTVIDPFLMLLNIERTNKNRYTYSLFSNIGACIFISILYYVRFGRIENVKDKIENVKLEKI
jgi:hypothetical protein